MRGCEDEKMFLQTPTIGRTLRSDALGKKDVAHTVALHYSLRIRYWEGYIMVYPPGFLRTILTRHENPY